MLIEGTVYKQSEELTSRLNEWLYKQTDNVEWPNGLQEKWSPAWIYITTYQRESPSTTTYSDLSAMQICGWNA